MRATLGLLLLTALAGVGVWPAEAGAKERGSLQAQRLDSCRQKLAPSLEAKLGGHLEARNELRREYAERRQALLDSNPDIQKLEAELRAKLAKLRQEKGGDEGKVRTEVERLVRKSRALKKSLAGTGELKAMAEQLRGMDAKVQASASEALGGEPGCLEFTEALAREAGINRELRGLGLRERGNPEGTLK